MTTLTCPTNNPIAANFSIAKNSSSNSNSNNNPINYSNINNSNSSSSNTPENAQRERTEPDNGCEMRNETDRLRTFQDWPCPFISPNSLAKAGFFFLRKEDAVKCAFCPIEIQQWEEGDDPMDCHRKFSPNCPFVKESTCGGVTALDQEAGTNSGSEDTCGKYGIEVRPNSVPEDEASSGYSRYGANYSKLGIFNNRGPSYPGYANYESRLRSFAEWPKSMKQKPNELASAGFYYTGKGDQTVCFHCGGGLKDWEDDDDPWEQHALWFTKCNFLLLQKGQEFVSEVCNRKHEAVTYLPEPSTASAAPKTPTKTAKSPENAAASIFTKAAANDTKEHLPEENCKTASSSTLCKICYSKEVGVVFLPCGHLVACVDCAPALDRCAVCRKPLEATVRAYVS